MNLSQNKSDTEPDWVTRGRTLCIETATRFGLRYEIVEDQEYWFLCHYPAQPGLDFDLFMGMTDDMFTWWGDNWLANVFPMEADEKWSLVTDVMNGFLTGNVRIVLSTPIGWRRPYRTDVEMRIENRWTAVSTGGGLAFPPLVRATTVRNGHPTETGRLRVARKSALFVLIALALLWTGLH